MLGCTIPMQTDNCSQLLKEWKRKCKLLEANGKLYVQESDRVLSQQQAAIAKLQQENTALQEQLSLSRREHAGGLTPLQQQRSDKLMELADTYKRKIEVEKRHIAKLEKELDVCQAKALETRKGLGGPSAAQDTNTQAAKHIKTLEDRLELTVQKFNETLSKNKVLRQQLDALCRDRETFQEQHGRRERELAALDEKAAGLREAVAAGNDARAQAAQDAVILAAQRSTEETAFRTESARLQEMLQHNQELLREYASRVAQASEAGARGEEEPQLDDAGVLQRLQQAAGVKGASQLVQHVRDLEARERTLLLSIARSAEESSVLQRKLHSASTSEAQATAEHDQRRRSTPRGSPHLHTSSAKTQTLSSNQALQKRQLELLQLGVHGILQTFGADVTESQTGPGPEDVEHLFSRLALVGQRAKAITAAYVELQTEQ